MDFTQAVSNKKSARIAHIFHLLGTDCKRNIDIILTQTCQILDGACSIYYRIDDKQSSLISWAGHNSPRDLNHNFTAKGHICRETTFKNENKPITLPDLSHTPFFTTDPNIQKYNLKSYLGFPVTLKKKIIGSLCILYTKTRDFTHDEINCIQALAAALSLEEERLSHAKNQKKDSDILLENGEDAVSTIKALEEKLEQAEKMKLIGTVAGGVAHDLNNILSGLVSYPELLLMQLDPDSPLKEPISFIHDAGLKAADIVQDLLTLTRRGISIENILNFNNLMHEYLNSPAHKRLEQSYPQIQFKTHSEADLLNIIGSPSHITKIIMNLVINATEAITEKGVVLIESFNQYVDIPLSGYDTILEGEYVVLRVTDDGTGISKDDLSRIFEPFYTKKRMGRSGSGLGLSVVWNAVKDHNGYIEVTSKLDEGSVFELYFPATRKTTDNDPGDFLIENFKGNKETVLVIDDVEEQRRIARDTLELLGYAPFTASSGENAIVFIKNRPVDLILLDMQMEPGIDGLEAYKEILKLYPAQKAVIASGFSENARVKETRRLGAGQYIKKPYTIKKLAYALKKELST